MLKAKRDEYASTKSDVAKAFFGKSSDVIFSNPDMIYQDKNFKIIKLRQQNTASKLSKRDGFRIIYLINNKKDIVCLFYVYPKAGSLGQIDISNNDLANFVDEYVKDREDKLLVCHDITNELSINNKDLCHIEDCEYEQISCKS